MRACFGHSHETCFKINYFGPLADSSDLPPDLYHATNWQAAVKILREGITRDVDMQGNHKDQPKGASAKDRATEVKAAAAKKEQEHN